MESDKYLYINKSSLSIPVCLDIIELFEKEEKKYAGITLRGKNSDIKDTYDYVIDNNDPKWKKYYNLLHSELNRNINYYLKSLNKDNIINNYNQNTTQLDYSFFNTNLSIQTFQVQRYTKNKGKYVYHNDSLIDSTEKKYRVFTFLWYLNSVEEGGETAFNGNTFIKPEIGKLVLFPATWTYPHCGRMPISSDKYIITGWVYADYT
jgi:hypothetical protein